MVDAPKDASGRVDALNAGGTDAAPFFSIIGKAVRRGEFFAGLFILGFSNGIFERIAWTIENNTIENAILGTFGISVLVWVACVIAVSLLLRQPPEPVTRNDLILGVAVTAAALVPSAKASWIALTVLGLYGLRCFEAGAPGGLCHPRRNGSDVLEPIGVRSAERFDFAGRCYFGQFDRRNGARREHGWVRR
jgi:hypothetical protein